MLNDVEVEGALTIPAGAEVTIDLNGHSISGTCDSGEAHLIMVENGATLNVKDASAGETGKITFARGSSNVGWVIDVEGELNLYSGTIELTGDSWSIGYAVDVRPNSWGTEYTQGTAFHMYGGKLVSSDGALRVASSSAESHEKVSASFVMDDGEIVAAWDGIFIQQSNAAYDILSVEINGGSVSSALAPIRFYGPAAASTVGGVELPMTLDIGGGTFKLTAEVADRTWLVDKAIMLGDGMASDPQQLLSNATIAITGGTFDGDPSGYVYELNKEYVVNGSGPYTVSKYAPYTPPASSGSTSTTVTIPVSGEENTVHAEVTVSSDGAVEVTPLDEAEIESIVGDDVQTGVVTIDLSELDSDVTSVTLPVSTLDAITKAAEAARNDTESIEIRLPQGTVEIDDAAMRAVLDQAQGSEVVLVLENTGTSKLNDEQLAALEGADVQGGYEAYFECAATGERIGDFKGGTATLSVPFDVPEGKKGSGYSVWYVSDDGEVEKMKTFHVGGRLMWHVPHMSDYIVVYEDHPSYEDCDGGEGCPLAAFPDVKAGAWYHDGLHWAVESGVLKGGDDGKMRPNGKITREELMVMLHRYAAAAGMNTAVYEDASILSYGDAEDVSTWAMTAMQWACGSGVMQGYDTGFLGPQDVLTREQTATFLHRFASYLGMDVSEGEDTNILSFADALEVNSWAIPAMQWACGAGVITGYADASGAQTGELGPRDGCTRAQAATMLMRFDAIA